ncbi:hypothetical protein GG344DRAFT_71046 [Lentinula edodes]|nr:hypothetical protein GG344DRAFT_71046 [Lentinula edodes]
MTVGLAGIDIEYPEGTFAADAPDMANKQEQITKNERQKLNVEFFINLINPDHLEIVGSTQWMKALFNQIPKLAHYRPHIAMIYETKAAINVLTFPKSTLLHQKGREKMLWQNYLVHF